MSEEGGHQLRTYLPAPTTPPLTTHKQLFFVTPTHGSHGSHFSDTHHVSHCRSLGMQRAVHMMVMVCRVNHDTAVRP